MKQWFYKFNTETMNFQWETAQIGTEHHADLLQSSFSPWKVTPENWALEDLIINFGLPTSIIQDSNENLLQQYGQITASSPILTNGITTTNFNPWVNPSPWVHAESEEGLLKLEQRRYDTPNDVKMRLNDTIVRLKGYPVYCTHTGETLKISCTYLAGPNKKKNEIIDSSDPELDITSPPLGYINFERVTGFAMRFPKRMQKQGINHENTRVLFEGQEQITPKWGWGHENIYKVGASINNEYPDFDSCVKGFQKRFESLAFDRTMSLNRTNKEGILKLKYKSFTAGLYFPDAKTLLVIPEFENSYYTKKFSNFMRVENVKDNSNQY